MPYPHALAIALAVAVSAGAAYAQEPAPQPAPEPTPPAPEPVPPADPTPPEPPAEEPAPTITDDDVAPPEEGEAPATSLPDKEVKVGGSRVGPTTGGATGFSFAQGFSIQSALGGFVRLGGFTRGAECEDPEASCSAVVFSQVHPFVGLTAGYDITREIAVQVSAGSAFVSNAAPYAAGPEVPRDYALTFADVGAGVQLFVLERLAVTFGAAGGVTYLTPKPALDHPELGGNASVTGGARLASLLPGMSVSVDVGYRAAFVPDGKQDMLVIHGFSLAPAVRYVF